MPDHQNRNLCACGEQLEQYTGRHTGTVWVWHPKGNSVCPRRGFEAQGPDERTAWLNYVNTAPPVDDGFTESEETVSNGPAPEKPKEEEEFGI